MTGQATTTITRTADNPAKLVLLVFKIENQLYGLPVTSVIRIIEMVTITPLPDAPEFIEGIINLQGKATPVMNLRRRLDLPSRAYGLRTPIILVDLMDQGHVLGLIVDTVEDVLEVGEDKLDLTETVVPTEWLASMATQTTYLAGVAKVDRRLIIVLNIQTLLNSSAQKQLLHILNLCNSRGIMEGPPSPPDP